MTREEKELLLTTARVLRAHLRDMQDTPMAVDLQLSDDIAGMVEALEPFEGEPGGEDLVAES